MRPEKNEEEEEDLHCVTAATSTPETSRLTILTTSISRSPKLQPERWEERGGGLGEEGRSHTVGGVGDLRLERKCKMFYQYFKCKTFYTCLPWSFWLTENILLLTKYLTTKQTLKNVKISSWKYFTLKTNGEHHCKKPVKGLMYSEKSPK